MVKPSVLRFGDSVSWTGGLVPRTLIFRERDSRSHTCFFLCSDFLCQPSDPRFSDVWSVPGICRLSDSQVREQCSQLRRGGVS